MASRKRAAEGRMDESTSPTAKLYKSIDLPTPQVWEPRQWIIRPIKRILKYPNTQKNSEEDSKISLRLFQPSRPELGDASRLTKYGYVSISSPHGRAFVTTHWIYQDDNFYLRDFELFSRLQEKLLSYTICFHVPHVLQNIDIPSSNSLEISLAFHGRSFKTALETRIVQTGFDFVSIFLQISWLIFSLYETTPEDLRSTISFKNVQFSVQLAPCNGYFLFKYILPTSETESKVLSLTTRIKVTITALPNFSPNFMFSTSLNEMDSYSKGLLALNEMHAVDNQFHLRAKRTRSVLKRRERRINEYCILDVIFQPNGIWEQVSKDFPPDAYVFKFENGKDGKMSISDFFSAYTPASEQRRSGRESWLDIRNMFSRVHSADTRQFILIQTIHQSPPKIDGQDPLLPQQREQWVSEMEAPRFDSKPLIASGEEGSCYQRVPDGQIAFEDVEEHPISAIEAHLAPLNAPRDDLHVKNDAGASNLPFALPGDSASVYIAPSTIFDPCTSIKNSPEGLFTGGAGLGIFASKLIPARTLITCYTGNTVSVGFVDRTKGNFFNTHLLTASYAMSTQIDGLRYPQPGKGVASLVNSTVGIDGKKMRSHNACFDDVQSENGLDSKKVIRAVRDIQPGEEILISYVWI